jgi:hypothetical protein
MSGEGDMNLPPTSSSEVAPKKVANRFIFLSDADFATIRI